MIGWLDADGSSYLIPGMVRAAVEALIGRDGLGGLSNEALAGQLEALGYLASHDPGRRTKIVRVGAGTQRLLHLTAAALSAGAAAEEGGEVAPA